MKDIYFIINNKRNHKNIINCGGGASEFLFYLTASKLSNYFNVTIFNRNPSEKIENIEYKFLPNNMNPSIENIHNSVIIVQRHFCTLIDLHKINPNNKYILWSHDFLGNKFDHLAGTYTPDFINDFFYNNNIITVTVSKFHKTHISNKLPNINCISIYNALFSECYIKNEHIKVNKDYIIFASNWGKGLNKVINIGKEYYRENNNFKLLLLKPSYCNSLPDLTQYPFIQMIGNVKNKEEYCKLLQGCLCVLTTSYPETFGCVFAEALHLGVPVIGDSYVDAGFHEIIKSEHMCNFNNPIEVIKKINDFRNNRPTVNLDNKFYSETVIEEWKDLINNI
jgi:glycosyltransferase involved in cell wall biosynthesis